LIFCILSSFSTSSTQAIFECNYNNLNFYTLNDLYTCDVTNNPNIINEQSAAVNSISGSHLTSKTNDDVAGLYLYNKVVNYFPKNLEKFFKILKLIYINGCGLKEVHQEDLKPFVDLVFLYLGNNAIEIIEQDLFAYNPNLDFISFDNNKIVHIDSNVFDNLDKLSCFWFAGIPCFGQQASNTREKTVELISITKYKCKNSEIRTFEADIKYLEDNVKVFNPEGLKDKFEALVKSFENSRFSKFRPLKNKFEDLKKVFNPDPVVIGSPVTEKLQQAPEITSNSCQFDSLELKLNNFWNDKLTKIDNKFDGLKASQCAAKDTLTDLLTSQSTLNDLKTSQNEAKSSITSLDSKISTIISFQESSQTQMTFSLNSLQSNLNNLKDITKQSQDDIKTSLSDMEATFSDTKIFQNEVKSSLNKLKTTQNELKISLNEIKATKSENSDEKLTIFGDKLESFEGKLGNIEAHFEEFEVKNAAKLDKIEREFTTNRHKISINFDDKMKGVEKRIMKKFEEVLEEKLGKIIEEKLMSVIESKFGKD